MKISFILYIWLMALSSNAQESSGTKSASNTLYAEVLGSGIRISVNYDHLFTLPLKNIYLSAGGGISPYKEGQSFAYVYFPIHGLVLYRFNNSFAELGLVWTFGRRWSGSYLNPSFYPGYNLQMFTPKVGYRFEPPKGGVFFEATFILLDNKPEQESIITGDFPFSEELEIGYNSRFYPWFGISVGYTFKPRISVSQFSN